MRRTGLAALCISAAIVLALFAAVSLYHAKNETPQRPALWAQPVELPHSANFFRVDPDLYRAAQPTAEAMRAYDAFGIKTVINLRSSHSDEDEVRDTKLGLVWIPVRTRRAGREEVAVRVLQAIRDAEKPVLVHCWHGADRTGMVMALYRIVEQGWTKEEALRELRDGGYNFHSIWGNITTYIEEADIESIRATLR